MAAGAVLSFQVSAALGNGEMRMNRGEMSISHPPLTRGEGRIGWGWGRMEQEFCVALVPCPGYVLTQKMAILPLHRAGSFWNFSSAFTCPVGERDSHCQLSVCKFAYEPFYQSGQASSHHEVNRPGLSIYFQGAYETEKIKMCLIRSRSYTVRFSCSRLT